MSYISCFGLSHLSSFRQCCVPWDPMRFCSRIYCWNRIHSFNIYGPFQFLSKPFPPLLLLLNGFRRWSQSFALRGLPNMRSSMLTWTTERKSLRCIKQTLWSLPMVCSWSLAARLLQNILVFSTMKWLLTTALCNLFQSLNNLMSWYASEFRSIFLYIPFNLERHFFVQTNLGVTFSCSALSSFSSALCNFKLSNVCLYCWVAE